MTARVLVVDDLLPNLKLLEARLSAGYFDVLTATNGADALEICAKGECDIVLLDGMMPGIDGLEVCRRLKTGALTSHIPVVMLTALNQPADRLRSLNAGADDFLTKPVDPVALLARVRSISKLRLSLDELRSRALQLAKLGIGDPFAEALADDGSGGRIMLVEDCPSTAAIVKDALRRHHHIETGRDWGCALDPREARRIDLFIVSLDLARYDGLRYCARLRSQAETLRTPVLAIASAGDRQKVLRGLDIGVSDFVLRPPDDCELAARTLIKRKRYADCLRGKVDAMLEMAASDPLTGLKNRRYLEVHLASLLKQSRGDPLCAMILDLDGFKLVNDLHGHAAGDQVLRCFAARAGEVLRAKGLLCRLGGDEFAAVMPETSISAGLEIAENIRSAVSSDSFAVTGDVPVSVTVSAGLAESAGDTCAGLLHRADVALYRAKRGGRNRISAHHAANGRLTG